MMSRGAPIEKVRIMGVFAHVDAGKTTTSEAILYHTGRIHRTGSVDDGDTQLDWMDQERERGITIMAAATACHWKGHRINLIDTPGHIDFSAEVVRSVRVIDGAVVILCGVGGVEPQTEAVWMHADRESVPRIVLINKLDRAGADFDHVLAEIRERLTPNALPLQLPIGIENTFRGVVDLVRNEALVWQDGAPEQQVVPVPADMRDRVTEARERLIDDICENDDELLALRLEGIEPDTEALTAALRKAAVSGRIVPVLCGATRHHIGVEPLLDSIVAYLPAPTDMRPILGIVPGTGREGAEHEVVERADSPDAPLCAMAFKIVTDPHVGHLTWVRVFSGMLRVGETVYNPRAEERERVGRIYRMHGTRREQVDHMAASDVVALVGVKSAITGDTLCDPDHPILLEASVFPEPVTMLAVAPGSELERDKLRQAIVQLCSEDPTLTSSLDPETGEQTLAGMGELHLEVAVERIRREYGLSPIVGRPEVSYRETVRRHSEQVGTYKKQSGGRGHFAEVYLRVEPQQRGEGVLFENEAPPSEFPRDFVRPTELGVLEALGKGIVGGYPVTDVRVTLLGGKFHEIDSAAMDFHIAGSMAVRSAVRDARPALLEPMMSLNMTVAEDHIGSIVGDIGRRRGNVRAMRVRGAMRTVEGEVPLAETFGYATDLRSMTQGRGTFSLEFDRYDVVPDGLAAEVIKQRQADGKVPFR
jgi:elongation factor G